MTEKRFDVHVFEVLEPTRPAPESRDVMVSVTADDSLGVDRLARAAAAAIWRRKYADEMPVNVGTVVIHEERVALLDAARHAA